MEGIRITPSAATVAGPEPEIAAKKQDTITHTSATPFLRWPTQAFAKSISFSDIPAFSIMLPATIKNGIASNENLLDAENTLMGNISIGSPVTTMLTMLAIPRETAMGMLHINKMINIPNKTKDVFSITFPPSIPRSGSQGLSDTEAPGSLLLQALSVHRSIPAIAWPRSPAQETSPDAPSAPHNRTSFRTG